MVPHCAMSETAALCPQETCVIDQLQGGFPLVSEPFAQAGAVLGMSQQALLDTIGHLLQLRVLTRFGPLYQIERMGGQFVLAALEVPPERFDEVAAQVNALDAVAHNYQRDHRLNMWFVLATASTAAMQTAQADIERRTGLPLHAFPKLREYYVGMRFTVGGQHAAGLAATSKATVSDLPMPEHLWPLVRATQAGLPLHERPYTQIADAMGWTEADVLQGLQQLLDAGIIRRIGVVPNHYAIGYRFNAMAVFDVEDDQLDTVGTKVGALDFVTHCYQRPRHLPLWPYNLFAMCHGNSRAAVLEQVQQIRSLLGTSCRQHDALFSTRILKKTGLRV